MRRTAAMTDATALISHAVLYTPASQHGVLLDRWSVLMKALKGGPGGCEESYLAC